MTTPPGTAELDLRGLRKSFGDVEAVRDLSLQVGRGEVFGFLGPNGAGKTTTIRMVCGLLRPDAGEVRVAGTPFVSDPAGCRRRIGFCPQELVLWETLTCLEQLEFAGRQYDLPRADSRARARELLEALGLSEQERRLAVGLSGGMKRRLNLALALMHDPEILVLDEPQAGLDPQSRILVRELIRELARERTVVLTTHEMDEADRLADRVGIIDRGRMLEVEEPEALKRRVGGEQVVELRLAAPTPVPDDPGALPHGAHWLDGTPETWRVAGSALGAHLPEILGAAERSGASVEDVTLRKPTLEDVFISLTGRRLRE